MTQRLILGAFLVLAAGCGDDDGTLAADGGRRDAGGGADAGAGGDAGADSDAAGGGDAGGEGDAGPEQDAGGATDAGAETDAGPASDGGIPAVSHNCDVRTVACFEFPAPCPDGQVRRVNEAACWGECVSIRACQCDEPDDCPLTGETYTCEMETMRCIALE